MTRTRPGFTLLELLLATVLTTMLMIGVLAVVTRLSPTSGAAETSTEVPGPGGAALDAWAALLREDLSLSGGVRVVSGTHLTLFGCCALDADRRRQTHRPARIDYAIAVLDGRRWLVRRQAALDVLTNQNVRRDLVCTGITRFELQPLSGAQTPRHDDDTVQSSSHGASTASSTTPAAVSGDAPANDEPDIVNSPGFWRRYAARIAELETSAKVDATAATGAEMVPSDAPSEAEVIQPAVAAWRLRVWTNDLDAPTYDRVLVIR